MNGTRRVATLKDIAAAAGVHESTVSRALNGSNTRPIASATAKRIRRIAEELGYQPDALAAGLRRGVSRSIGIVVEELTDTHTATIIRGLHEELDSHGVMAVIAEVRDDASKRDQACEFLLGRRVDALILMSARETDGERLQALAKRVPLLLCMQDVPGSGLPCVAADDYAGGALAAGYLARLGHETVAQLFCDVQIHSMAERRKGFTETAERLGMRIVDLPPSTELPSMAVGRDLAAALLSSSQELPSAIFAHTDSMAMGAISVLKSSGIDCPNDVSIIGYDNNPVSEFMWPALTTISVPAFAAGKAAAKLAMQTAYDKEGGTSHIFKPRLVVRGSAKSVHVHSGAG